MSIITPDTPALDDLTAQFRGELVRPDEPSYDELRRVWNGSIDRRPALIARCTGVGDIRAALAFARRTGLPVAVRGGGHSFPGHSTCDGGIVIDLAPLKEIESIRYAVPPGLRRVSSSVSSIARHRRSASPRRRASSRTPVWPVSRWAVGSAG